jgi:hypothetical protein
MFSWDETIPQQTRIKPSVKEEEQKTRGVISGHNTDTNYFEAYKVQNQTQIPITLAQLHVHWKSYLMRIMRI